MALFTDGPASSIDDLTAQDAQLLDVARVENINLTQKLALAHEELALELASLFGRLSYSEQAFWCPAAPTIQSVVVTPPLKMWHTFRTLEMTYADAYNSQLNDRYAGRRDQYRASSRWAYGKLVEAGVGIVGDPIPRAATPTLTEAPGNLPDGSYYVATGWINKAGEEGASAAPAVITTVGSSFLVQPGTLPSNVTGWHIYAGPAPDGMVRQNSSPIPAATNWVQPNQLSRQGAAPANGQLPNYLKPTPRVLQRG